MGFKLLHQTDIKAHLQPQVFDHPLKARTQRRGRSNGRWLYYKLQMERVRGAFSCSLALELYRRAAYDRTDPITPSDSEAICAASAFDESLLKTGCYLLAHARHGEF